MNIVDLVSQKQINPNVPEFRVGDTVRVDYTIIEGEKERVQAFEGLVVSKKGKKAEESFTVRKISYGIGVERVFPVNSPRIAKLTVVRKGKSNRAKLDLRNLKVDFKTKERE